MSEPNDQWTHAICRACYELHEPGRIPIAVEAPEVEYCCFCDALTCEGIYYRADPRTTLCRGIHVRT